MVWLVLMRYTVSQSKKYDLYCQYVKMTKNQLIVELIKIKMEEEE